MTELTDILQHIPGVLLVIARIGGLMIFAPVISSSVVPIKVRVFLALVLGLAIYPAVGAAHVAPVPELWSIAPLMAVEFLIGLVIGWVAMLPLIACEIGGLVMAQQMGLGFARFFNPALEDDANVLGHVLFFTALGGFLLVGGLESMVLGILHSFDHLPPPAAASMSIDGGLITMVGGLLTAITELSLRIAAPLLAVIFLQTLAMGFTAKTVPQLNILSLGFPVRIISGLVIVMLGLTVIDQVVMEGIDDMWAVLFEWIQGL